MEFLDGVFTHLALVNNPRYERANIVFNSKTYNVDNGGNGSGHHNHAGIKGFRGGSLPRGYNTNFINELDNFIKTATEDKYYNGETHKVVKLKSQKYCGLYVSVVDKKNSKS